MKLCPQNNDWDHMKLDLENDRDPNLMKINTLNYNTGNRMN